MPAIIDITGQRFGRLVALGRAPSFRRSTGSTRTTWLCRCDCGRETVVATTSLRTESHPTRSCGCSKDGHPTHGQSKSRLHNIWQGMKDRCLNSKAKPFDRYGGRGIEVCAEWRDDFAAFRDWSLANGYQPDLTIERMHNDGDYEPGNCRFATYREQGRNKRNNRAVLRSDGRYFPTIAEAAEALPGGHAGIISDVCRGRGRTHRGFGFVYVEDIT